MNRPAPFAIRSNLCTRHDLGWNIACFRLFLTQSSFTKSVTIVSVVVSKITVVLPRTWSESLWSLGPINGISYHLSKCWLPLNMSQMIILSFCNIAPWCTVGYAQHSSLLQHAAQKSPLLLSSYGLQQPRAEPHWLQGLLSHTAAHGLRVIKIEEIKQQLVEVWQSSNSAFDFKYAIFVFRCFARKRRIS